MIQRAAPLQQRKKREIKSTNTRNLPPRFESYLCHMAPRGSTILEICGRGCAVVNRRIRIDPNFDVVQHRGEIRIGTTALVLQPPAEGKVECYRNKGDNNSGGY